MKHMKLHAQIGDYTCKFVRKMMRVQGNAPNAARHEAPDDVAKKRSVANGDEWLRKLLGEWAEPSPEASAEDHRRRRGHAS